MIFSTLLKEAIDDKQFDDVEGMVKAVKSILRKATFPRYKESKAKSDKGFATPTQYGYKYRYLNGVVTITFFGAETKWISELARALSMDKVHYHFNDKADIFLIKADDNVKPLDLMTPDAVDEYESGMYEVLGTTVDGKTEIKAAIENFNPTQKKIYDELIHRGMAEWRMVRTTLGKDVTKFRYRLVPIKIDSDK